MWRQDRRHERQRRFFACKPIISPGRRMRQAGWRRGVGIARDIKLVRRNDLEQIIRRVGFVEFESGKRFQERQRAMFGRVNDWPSGRMPPSRKKFAAATTEGSERGNSPEPHSGKHSVTGAFQQLIDFLGTDAGREQIE